MSDIVVQFAGDAVTAPSPMIGDEVRLAFPEAHCRTSVLAKGAAAVSGASRYVHRNASPMGICLTAATVSCAFLLGVVFAMNTSIDQQRRRAARTTVALHAAKADNLALMIALRNAGVTNMPSLSSTTSASESK